MTKPTTEELKDLLGKVTQGEWTWHDYDDCNDGNVTAGSLYADKPVIWHCECVSLPDARLIALAPTLAAEVVALREEVDMWRMELSALLEAYEKPDARMCCDGQMCGCMGATNHQYAEYVARHALSQK